jgi:hypothetical protein
MSDVFATPRHPLLIDPDIKQVFEAHLAEGSIEACLNNAIESMHEDNMPLRGLVAVSALAHPEPHIDAAKPEQIGAMAAIFELGAYASYMSLDLQVDGNLPRPSKQALDVALEFAPNPLPESATKRWHFAINPDETLQEILELVTPPTLTDNEEDKDALWSGAGLVRYMFMDYISRFN